MFARLLAPALLFLALVAPAMAQGIPNAYTQNAIIKSALITFNDANLTGNYSVMHDRSAKAFQDTFEPGQIADMFKAFHDQQIDLTTIVSMDYVEDAAPAVDDKGVLTLKGHFETTPSKVTYELEFVLENENWRMIGINVNVG